MKYLAVLIIAFAALVAADDEWKPLTEKETLHKLHDDCLKESAATPEQITKMENLEHPDEKEVHDYVHCIATKVGIFNDESSYDLDRVMKQFSVMFADVEKIRDIVTNCVDDKEKKGTPAERAFRGFNCIMESKIGETMKASKKAA